MFVDVSGVRKSPGKKFHLDLAEKLPALGVGSDEIIFPDPVQISLDVENTGRVLIVRGSIMGDLELVCSRCLEHYPYHVEAAFEEQFCGPSDVAELVEEGRDLDEIHVIEGNKVELDDFIQESIYLSLPMKTICRENCSGLCAVCGTNLNRNKCECKHENIDPRLRGLQKFFEDRES